MMSGHRRVMYSLYLIRVDMQNSIFVNVCELQNLGQISIKSKFQILLIVSELKNLN